MHRFGLIGKKLGHSFSKRYFSEKFAREGIADAAYELYELAAIADFPALLASEPELVGLNVTVPYKEAIIPYLHRLDKSAARIGAVNTIKIEDGRTTGYNTDFIGFRDTLQQFYPADEAAKALVLGTGGAAKAVWAALDELAIPHTCVSRNPAQNQLTYEAITPEVLQAYTLIINTTPLGMAPATDTAPAIPYEALSPRHYLYDLVYNPQETLFLQKGRLAGAQTINGLPMLYAQADAAWKIWSNENPG
ncbi:shikimate dehydrogenase [Pontibacter sp. HSC-14F20]|uniref:shikimate dehydrogenase family protein n=1 Tax=Pontibacter sp. HSC-14F20 TaxID=2864136 RepID=UPI001C72EDDD|nr:shikimate dehydrogenase [Pontibacter sp. HSC-14F20]MBX0333507.1 shikimate dehydrogenase [Pontibacter sp. HSC-14F20]